MNEALAERAQAEPSGNVTPGSSIHRIDAALAVHMHDQVAAHHVQALVGLDVAQVLVAMGIDVDLAQPQVGCPQPKRGQYRGQHGPHGQLGCSKIGGIEVGRTAQVPAHEGWNAVTRSVHHVDRGHRVERACNVSRRIGGNGCSCCGSEREACGQRGGEPHFQPSGKNRIHRRLPCLGPRGAARRFLLHPAVFETPILGDGRGST
jgi:hypothetical protein